MDQKWNLQRILTVSLGGLWLLDGVLQLQPAMFTSAFVTTVLAPNLQSQPLLIENIVAFGIKIFSLNIFWCNLASALIQLAIGILLIFPFHNSILRFGLWLSVVWALIIWIFGEGFGNLFTGSAIFYTGAPGSALLYLIIALFLLFSWHKKLPLAAGILFLLCALLPSTPIWQLCALICLGALLIFVPRRPVAWATIIFLLVAWWLGQSFGGLATFPSGTATDPNSAPLFILFLIPIFFAAANADPLEKHQHRDTSSHR